MMMILLTRIIRASAAMLAPRITKASCVGSTLRERILYSLRLEKVDSLNYKCLQNVFKSKQVVIFSKYVAQTLSR